jgi:hypothetical protein
MKGIYITEQAKQEIEAKIAKIEKDKYANLRIDLSVYKEILQSAIVLPVVNWEDTYQTILTDALNKEEFSQGVIIQPK